MAILETSFIVDILRGKKGTDDVLRDLERKEHSLFVASPAVMELWDGALRSAIPEREKARVEDFISATSVLAFDEECAKRAAEINFGLERNGIMIEIPDIMTAGIAMVHGETVVTRDFHFSHIPGLKVLKC